MIDKELVQIGAVLIDSIGILIAERKTAILLGIFTILTVIIFFMT